MSVGWTPSVQLHCQSGGKPDLDTAKDALVPRPGTGNMRIVEAANGTFGLSATLQEAGLRATGGIDWASHPARPNPQTKGRVWIEFQNDVTVKDVDLAAREGFTSVENLKRYTTLGMATDQGPLVEFRRPLRDGASHWTHHPQDRHNHRPPPGSASVVHRYRGSHAG